MAQLVIIRQMRGRCLAAQLAIIRQMSGQVTHGSAGDYQADERKVSRGSAGDYQADELACVARLSWRVLGRRAGRCRRAQLASIRQMSRQVSRS